MAKKICILSGIYPPEVGGPATFAERFTEFSIEHGLNVKVLTYCDGKSRTSHTNNKTVYQISRDIFLPFRYLWMCYSILKSYFLGYKIIANGCFLEIAIVRLLFPIKYVTKIPGDIVWERARNKGQTSSDIDTFQQEPLSFSLRIMRLLFRFSLVQSKKVIVPSKHLYLLAVSWGVEEGKIQVIHNSISLRDFPFTRRNHYDFDLISVSRLVEWKGLCEVVKVAAETGLSLGLVGTGPEEDHLRELSSTLGAKVTFLGSKNQQELSEIYSQSNYFVLNSNFEATSYALLEARATGLISIANLNTGSEEIIHHMKDGLLCGPNLSLLQAVQLLVSGSINSEEFEESARRDTENRFDQKRNFQAILDVI